jgi:hypothetical protein
MAEVWGVWPEAEERCLERSVSWSRFAGFASPVS